MVISVYKWLSIPIVLFFMNFRERTHTGSYLSPSHTLPMVKEKIGKMHPYYVSVTEINHNTSDKTLEISCKIFTDDFEKTLQEKFKTKIDLVKPVNKPAIDKFITDYIQKHLSIKLDNKPASFTYQGFEVEGEAAYSYFLLDNISAVKKIEVVNSILYDMYENEVNIIHVTVGGTRKSTKLEFPKTEAAFLF